MAEVTTERDNTVVAGMLHLEILVADPRAAADYFAEVFGAVEVEKEFAAYISERFDCEDIHMKAGGVIFQFIKPKDEFRDELNTWWKRDELKNGNFIHNITLFINDPEALEERIAKKGGIKMGKAQANAPDGVSQLNVHMYDLREQCGMNVEFIQTPPPLMPK